MSTLKELKELQEGKTARAAVLSALIAAGGTFAATDVDKRPVADTGERYTIPWQKPLTKPVGKVTINGKIHHVYWPGGIAYPATDK